MCLKGFVEQPIEMKSVNEQVYHQVSGRVVDQVGVRVWVQVREQVYAQVLGQVYQVWDQVKHEIG